LATFEYYCSKESWFRSSKDAEFEKREQALSAQKAELQSLKRSIRKMEQDLEIMNITKAQLESESGKIHEATEDLDELGLSEKKESVRVKRDGVRKLRGKLDEVTLEIKEMASSHPLHSRKEH